MNGILFLNVNMFEDEMLYEKAVSMISEERKQKVRNLKTSMPARLSLGAGVLLRIALDQCDLTDKQNELQYGEHGKPYLADSEFHFSLSHSGEYAVCAYSDMPIGADLQKMKGQMPKHTKRILAAEERDYLDSLSETERITCFYRLWSRKESLIKWDGRGLQIPLQEISLIRNGKMLDEIIFEGKKVYFKEYGMFLPEYAFCICSQKEILEIQPFETEKNFLTNY